MGLTCYYHLKTGEVESHPDESAHSSYDEETWKEVIDKIDANLDDYMRFDVMESRESFYMMRDYIATIQDAGVQKTISTAIELKKPFLQFKNMLIQHPELKESWYNYKQQAYIDHIQEQIDMYNGRFIEENFND